MKSVFARPKEKVLLEWDLLPIVNKVNLYPLPRLTPRHETLPRVDELRDHRFLQTIFTTSVLCVSGLCRLYGMHDFFG